MIVPRPWEVGGWRKLPGPVGNTFEDVFWNAVGAYTGYSVDEFQSMLDAGAKLNASITFGAESVHEKVQPVVPARLVGDQVIRPIAPLSALPAVDICESEEAIMKLRSRCFQYTESIAQLLEATRNCCGHWGRLRRAQRIQLLRALSSEQKSRFEVDELCLYFTDLRLCGKGISEVTPTVGLFSNLTRLILSNNPGLTCVPYLPPACLVFIACGCSIESVCRSSTLLFLGLSFNAVKSFDFVNEMPALRVLDLTRNSVFDMEETVKILANHEALQEVTFVGCPIALTSNYTGCITKGCPRLRLLDGVVLSDLKDAAFTAVPLIDGEVTLASGNSRILSPDSICSGLNDIHISASIVKLEGVGHFSHTGVQREKCPSVDHSEVKLKKGKKKPKPAVLGPLYELRTSISLTGSWGENDGLTLASDVISLPFVATGIKTSAPPRAMCPAGVSADGVMEVGCSGKATLPISAGVSDSLSRGFILTLRVDDDIYFPNGDAKNFSYAIGSFVVDCSSLLVSGPLPRVASLKIPLVLSEAALEEKLLHAQELRKCVADSLHLCTMGSFGNETPPSSSAKNLCTSRKRSKKTALDRGSTSDCRLSEARRFEEDMEGMKLLASIEERRVEELRSLDVYVTLELAIGPPPKPSQPEHLPLGRNQRHRILMKGG